MVERQWPPELETKSLTAAAGQSIAEVATSIASSPGTVAAEVSLAVGQVASAVARVKVAREQTRQVEMREETKRQLGTAAP